MTTLERTLPNWLTGHLVDGTRFGNGTQTRHWCFGTLSVHCRDRQQRDQKRPSERPARLQRTRHRSNWRREGRSWKRMSVAGVGCHVGGPSRMDRRSCVQIFRDLNCAYTNGPHHCKIDAKLISSDDSRSWDQIRCRCFKQIENQAAGRAVSHGCFPAHRINAARTIAPTTRLNHGEISNATGSVPNTTLTIPTTIA